MFIGERKAGGGLESETDRMPEKVGWDERKGNGRFGMGAMSGGGGKETEEGKNGKEWERNDKVLTRVLTGEEEARREAEGEW